MSATPRIPVNDRPANDRLELLELALDLAELEADTDEVWEQILAEETDEEFASDVEDADADRRIGLLMASLPFATARSAEEYQGALTAVPGELRDKAFEFNIAESMEFDDSLGARWFKDKLFVFVDADVRQVTISIDRAKLSPNLPEMPANPIEVVISDGFGNSQAAVLSMAEPNAMVDLSQLHGSPDSWLIDLYATA